MRFGEEFGGDFEGVIRGGDAAVNGRVEENFLDFFARDAVVQSGTKMKAKFVLAIEGDGHGKSKKAARVAREAGARPNFAPGVARDEVLKGGCEVCAVLMARSTWALPRTSRRIFSPFSWRSRSSIEWLLGMFGRWT